MGMWLVFAVWEVRQLLWEDDCLFEVGLRKILLGLGSS